MRTTSLTNLLLSEAKRKPHIAELVARAEEMSDLEIEQADVPLPWFRLALKEIRGNRGHANFAAAINAGDVPGITFGFTPDMDGLMVAWTAEESWITLSPQGSMENKLLVPHGTLIFFPDSGGMWIDSIFVARPTLDLSNTRMVGRTNRMGYKIAQRERIQNGPDMLVVEKEAESRTESGLAFRIIRH